MVLSKTRPGSARPHVPGKAAWSVLLGALTLATLATFRGADRTILAPSIAVFHAGDTDHILQLKSEKDHAGA